MRKVDTEPDDRLVAIVNHLMFKAVVNNDNLTLDKWNSRVFADAKFEGIVGHLKWNQSYFKMFIFFLLSFC